VIAAPLIATLLAQSPALEQPTPPPNVAVDEPVARIPRFVAPLLGGASLVTLGVAVAFKVAEQDATSALRAPTAGITQRDAAEAAQRANTYSQLALAMFLSAAVMASVSIIVAVLTQWAD